MGFVIGAERGAVDGMQPKVSAAKAVIMSVPTQAHFWDFRKG
jgi:hypothetical protein